MLKIICRNLLLLVLGATALPMAMACSAGPWPSEAPRKMLTREEEVRSAFEQADTVVLAEVTRVVSKAVVRRGERTSLARVPTGSRDDSTAGEDEHHLTPLTAYKGRAVDMPAVIVHAVGGHNCDAPSYLAAGQNVLVFAKDKEVLLRVSSHPMTAGRHAEALKQVQALAARHGR
jgi:hypothetical protein